MKKQFLLKISTLLIIGLFTLPVYAFCTYQEFDINGGYIQSAINGRTLDLFGDKYNTHFQRSYHKQCWQGKSLNQVVVELTGSNTPTVFLAWYYTISSHGWLVVQTSTIHPGEWNVNITNYRNDGSIKDTANRHCLLKGKNKNNYISCD
ncbi:MAG: hypothetical protein A3F11_01460 [Gammaproteobacteria bacterium RIFCSPHIGHO2_12_FULL_37_14]|nr:MAG: hypothetical protein A3F11_01460 [Gammaproteobacteria bacterium RIFCSPHIGHO2_12_FULL_37_14]